MNATLYIIKSYHEEATVTVETNSAEVMFSTFDEALANGLPTEVINGLTGEIYALSNCGCEDYASDEFASLFLLELMAEAFD